MSYVGPLIAQTAMTSSDGARLARMVGEGPSNDGALCTFRLGEPRAFRSPRAWARWGNLQLSMATLTSICPASARRMKWSTTSGSNWDPWASRSRMIASDAGRARR
jgi:hypothetical protein